MAEGKVALVVGATSGMGAATAEIFGRDGCRVVVSGRRQEQGDAVVARIRAAGGEAIFVPVDVGSEQSVIDLIDRTVREYGRIDYAVNNAATEASGCGMADMTLEDCDYQMRINFRGVFLAMKYQIKEMLKTGGGAIVNIASTAGHVGFPYAAVYTASKHAVVGLTKATALEYIQQGIRINAISPGVMHTEMMQRFLDSSGVSIDDLAASAAIKRPADPAEVAAATVWLCSPAASFIVGQAIPVDGGLTAA